MYTHIQVHTVAPRFTNLIRSTILVANRTGHEQIKFPHKVDIDANHWIWFGSWPVRFATGIVEGIQFVSRGTNHCIHVYTVHTGACICTGTLYTHTQAHTLEYSMHVNTWGRVHMYLMHIHTQVHTPCTWMHRHIHRYPVSVHMGTYACIFHTHTHTRGHIQCTSCMLILRAYLYMCVLCSYVPVLLCTWVQIHMDSLNIRTWEHIHIPHAHVYTGAYPHASHTHAHRQHIPTSHALTCTGAYTYIFHVHMYTGA